MRAGSNRSPELTRLTALASGDLLTVYDLSDNYAPKAITAGDLGLAGTSQNILYFDTDGSPVGAANFLYSASSNTLTLAAPSAAPVFRLLENAATTDEKRWELLASGSALILRTRTDAGGAGETVMNIARSGTAVAAVEFGGAVRTSTLGDGFSVKQGANSKHGTFTANGSTAVVVGNTSVTADCTISFALKTVGGTPAGAPFLSAVTAATGFSVKAAVGDTSVYNYIIHDSHA